MRPLPCSAWMAAALIYHRTMLLRAGRRARRYNRAVQSVHIYYIIPTIHQSGVFSIILPLPEYSARGIPAPCQNGMLSHVKIR